MTKKMWFSLLMVNVMLIIFVGYWRSQKTSDEREHKEIVKTLDLLEKGEIEDFSLPNFEGKTIRLKSINGEIIMIHFWATWCAPCVIEYPALLNLILKFDGKIKLVAISADDDKEDAIRFFKKFGKGGKNVTHLWDPNQEIASAMGTEKLPETYIFDNKYHLIRKVPNTEDWISPRVIEFFDFILDKTQ